MDNQKLLTFTEKRLTANEAKTWSRGHSCRLPFVLNSSPSGVGPFTEAYPPFKSNLFYKFPLS